MSLRIAAVLASVVLVAEVRAEPTVGTPQGNALNPAPVNPATAGRWMDEDGLGTRIPAARTPTGQLYNMPLDPGEETEGTKGAWQYACYAELGGIRIGGDARSQGWRNYKDLRTGAYVNNFGVLGEKPDAARYFEAVGGAIGLQDQFYRFQAGRYNDWKISAFYDGTPQVFTTDYRSPWNGLGSGSLVLAALAPGGTANAVTTQANIENALAATNNSELEVIRRKAGVRLDMNLSDSWKLFASFTSERREGARPFGTVFGGGGGGGNIESAESIDYATHDFLAGVQFSDATASFNLRASASFFRNAIDTMTIQNPLFITTNGSTGLAPGVFTQGRFDLVPNNEHYNVKGEYARALPSLLRGNLTAAVAFGTMRQNDSLIAPTELPLTGGTVTAGGASLANLWNTTAALSRDSARARIDTRLADVGLSLKPVNGLDVRGKVRYYETRNSMQYLSCNPLTGQWGRLLNDGSGLSLVTASTLAGDNPAGTSANAFNAVRCDLAAAQALNLVPASGNIPIRSIPYEYRQMNESLAADYRLGKAASVNAAIEHESFRRAFRERDETWEDKLKLGWVDRGLIEGMIRLSYEYGRRRGSEYHANPYEPFLSASFGPTPVANTANVASWLHSLEGFRSLDLADRDQNVLNGRLDYAFHQNLDGAVTLQVKDAQFPSAWGRTGHQKSNSVTLDVSYQSGSTAVVYGFYSYQAGAMQQKGVHPVNNGCVLGTQNLVAANWMELCGTASATSPLFPESRAWEVDSKDRNGLIGIGVKYDFGKVRLDTNFTRTLGRTRISYAYNPAGLGMTALQTDLAGSGMSDLTFAQTVFSASVLVPLKKDVSLRLLVRHESGRIRDWHYDGVAANPMPTTNAAYLDAGPQDYRATLIGVLFQVRM